jgi:hypothetical protein
MEWARHTRRSDGMPGYSAGGMPGHSSGIPAGHRLAGACPVCPMRWTQEYPETSRHSAAYSPAWSFLAFVTADCVTPIFAARAVSEGGTLFAAIHSTILIHVCRRVALALAIISCIPCRLSTIHGHSPRSRFPIRYRSGHGRRLSRLPRKSRNLPSSPRKKPNSTCRWKNVLFDGRSIEIVSWCEGHHLWHWVDGGPTDLANLALVCRAHHRAVHEGGWQLTRGPDGHFTATPPHRGHPPHRRQRTAA